MKRRCSKCGIEAPFNPPNWIKLTESHITTYTITNAIYNTGHSESNPYWLLCPKCYREMFSGLKRYKTRTESKIIEDSPNYFTESTADYQNQETININSYGNITYPMNINTNLKADWTNKDTLDTGYTWEATPNPNSNYTWGVPSALDEQYQKFGYTRV